MASLSAKASKKRKTASESQLASSASKKKVKTDPGPLCWLKPLGPHGSCFHGVNLNPSSSTKVAAFDLDDTIIKFQRRSIPAEQWFWWDPSVPAKLAEAARNGYAIVLISNQAGFKSAGECDLWMRKIALIAEALPDVPFRIFAATSRDNYRKPMIGTWEELENLYAEDGIQIDRASSFFVGDLAGRDYPNKPKPIDYASTDRKWAINVGIAFQTPEEYFLGGAPDPNFTFKGFDVSALPQKLPLYMPSSSPLLPIPPVQELILFVGYPCVGKTTFFRKYFEPAGYLHVNQDTLKTRDKCVKAVQEALSAGKKCVVDDTNHDICTRNYYIHVAKKLGVPVRCMLFTGSIKLAWHNNIYRAYSLPPSVAAREPPRSFLTEALFTKFRDNFEEPELSEGISQIKKVNWVFDGTAEERKVWSRWLHWDEKKF